VVSCSGEGCRLNQLQVAAKTQYKPQNKSIMNTKIKLSTLLLAFILVSCSNEDDTSGEAPTNNTIEVSINEYPTSGDLVTTITSNLIGNLNFSITSQSVSQAMGIDSSSGEIRVLAWQEFDYETITEITLTVSITNGTDTEEKNVIVSIINVDDIWAFLNSSRNAYENAADGTWVMVTESEYNDLAYYMAEVTKSGATDSDLLNSANINANPGQALISNLNESTIPASSYVYAFKHYSWANNVSGTKVKLSTGTELGAYEALGEALPEHNAEYNHFVLKGNATPTTSVGYLAIYVNNSIGYKNISGSPYGWGSDGDTDFLTNGNVGAVFLYQGLSTTLKQWD